MTDFSDRAAARLKIAGRLLQADPKALGGQGLKIVTAPGESYPQAVLRTIQALPADEQTRLQSHVDWVEDYDRQSTPAP